MLFVNYDLDNNELKNAIIETFAHRETGFDDIVAFESDFTEDFVRQGIWKVFIKKKKTMMKIEFAEAIEQSKKLLMPIVKAIEQNKEFNCQWDKDRKDWISLNYTEKNKNILIVGSVSCSQHYFFAYFIGSIV